MSFTLPEPYNRAFIEYSGLGGVDLSSDSREIKSSRASNCINMYRCYSDGTSSFLQTRPGFEHLEDFGGRVYGVHFLEEKESLTALVHSGNGLYLWPDFPAGEASKTSLWPMNTCKSVSFQYKNSLFILDGESYIEFKNGQIKGVEGFIPTTRIAAAPQGKGEAYQSVNLLSPYRKNTFRGDGESTLYRLDATDIASVEEVYVNGEAAEDYSVSCADGTVEFVLPPSAPLLGDDNVVIVFKKEIEGYRERISGCRLALVFDNRIFFSGNENYPSVIFHSELDNPAYIADINYYEDGQSGENIRALAVKDNKLFAFKDKGANALYTHTPTLSYSLGRVYPASAGAVSLGCTALGGARVLRDDLVYLSPQGLEGIGSENGQYTLNHRSTMADGALLQNQTENASLEIWNGYLCILSEGRLFLGDSRNVFLHNGSYEYEWYIWQELYSKEESNLACLTFCRNNTLYFGTVKGSICAFKGNTDEGRAILSCWESRSESAGAPTVKKSVTKAGCAVLLKKISNSRVEVYAKADGNAERHICSVNMGGFDFAKMNFGALSFATGEDNLVCIPLNEKAFKTLKISLRSESVFGLGSLSYIAKLHNHQKY